MRRNTWHIESFARKPGGDNPPADEPDDNDIIEVPEDLTSLSNDDLASLLDAVRESFTAARAGELTEEILAELGTMADQIEALQAEVTRRDEEAAARAEAAAALEDRVNATLSVVEPDDLGDATNPGSGDGEPDAGDDAGESNDSGDSGDAENGGGDSEATTAAAAPATVPATPARSQSRGLANLRNSEVRHTTPSIGGGNGSRQMPSAGAVRRRQPAIETPAPAASLVAAAGVPNIQMGHRFNGISEDLARAFHDTARTLPIAHGNGREVPVVSIANAWGNLPEIRPDDPESAAAAFARATDPDTLLAAGGWCAPSETIYSLFDIDCVGNLLDLPSVNVSRGGIRFPVSPSMADVADCIWTWTEQNDIDALAGTPTKPCCRIDCPTFDEARLQCTGICITHGNLANAAYPELTQRWIQLTLAAHARLMNAQQIAAIVADSTAQVFPAEAGGALAPFLGAAELAAHGYREQWGMCCGDALELVAPCWLSGAFRSDLAKRTCSDVDSISDADVARHLSDRGLRIQYVRDWQPVGNVATTWPTQVQVLLYAPGTWVRGTGPTINLGVVRDSTLNETNDFTALWSEECWLLAKLGFESRLLTIPICPDGTTAATADFACSAA